MSHTRFALGFTRNRKVFALSAEAFRLWVSAIDYAREQKTDGVLTEMDFDAIPKCPLRGTKRNAVRGEMVTSGLLEVHGETWVVHDYLHWQDSAEEVAAKQERARERMRSVRANSSRTNGELRTKFDQHTLLSSSLSQTLPPEGVQGEPSAKFERTPAEKLKRQVTWPSDFDEKIRGKVEAWGKKSGYPIWWITERLAGMRDACLAKNLRYADWYLAAIGWLRREDQDFGNGPAALETRRAKNGATPPGFEQHNAHKQAQGEEIWAKTKARMKPT